MQPSYQTAWQQHDDRDEALWIEDTNVEFED